MNWLVQRKRSDEKKSEREGGDDSINTKNGKYPQPLRENTPLKCFGTNADQFMNKRFVFVNVTAPHKPDVACITVVISQHTTLIVHDPGISGGRNWHFQQLESK